MKLALFVVLAAMICGCSQQQGAPVQHSTMAPPTEGVQMAPPTAKQPRGNMDDLQSRPPPPNGPMRY